MRRGLNEVIPGKLYQRGHMLTWPRDDKLAIMEAAGVTAVVNLWVKTDPDMSSDRLVYLTWPMPGDRVPPNWELLKLMVVAMVRSGHTVLVHCEAGVNRSSWLCALVAHDLGLDAFDTVAAGIPRNDIRPGLRAHLTEATGDGRWT